MNRLQIITKEKNPPGNGNVHVWYHSTTSTIIVLLVPSIYLYLSYLFIDIDIDIDMYVCLRFSWCSDVFCTNRVRLISLLCVSARPTSAFLKVATYAAQLEQYPKAIEIYEQVKLIITLCIHGLNKRHGMPIMSITVN